MIVRTKNRESSSTPPSGIRASSRNGWTQAAAQSAIPSSKSPRAAALATCNCLTS